MARSHGRGKGSEKRVEIPHSIVPSKSYNYTQWQEVREYAPIKVGSTSKSHGKGWLHRGVKNKDNNTIYPILVGE